MVLQLGVVFAVLGHAGACLLYHRPRSNVLRQNLRAGSHRPRLSRSRPSACYNRWQRGFGRDGHERHAHRPGASAGIHQGDILAHWNGEPILHVQSLLRALGPDSVGRTLALGLRRTGQTQQVSLTDHREAGRLSAHAAPEPLRLRWTSRTRRSPTASPSCSQACRACG